MITLTNEMLDAINIIETTNQSLYITGKAGTGKTTFLRHIVANIKKRFIIAASTGIAAVNAGGVTLHSLFNIPFGVLVEGCDARTSYRIEKANLFNAIDAIIIDEISMVRPDTMDFIDRTLRMYRSSEEPFGGVQIIMFGDLFQLPPVVRKDEEHILLQFYKGPYFFYADVFKQSGFKVVELTHIFRQSDQRFIDILNHIREYNLTEDDIEELESLRSKSVSSSFDGQYVHLCSFRKDAQAINSEMLGSATHTYTASLSGDFQPNSAPCEQTLSLRVGARVMMLINDPMHLYCNGSLGFVVNLSDENVTIRLDNGCQVAVKKCTWSNKEYKMVNGKIETVEKGSCEQFPITLAWAITIHKSQGLTFDNVVLHTNRVFAPGQLYVALSRCRSLDGIVSNSFIGKKHILVDKTLLAFDKACRLNSQQFNKETIKLMKHEGRISRNR